MIDRAIAPGRQEDFSRSALHPIFWMRMAKTGTVYPTGLLLDQLRGETLN
jgi:hypothetical protein